MAVIIPNTDVSIDIVRSVLNYPSYDVGRLIVAARTGGIPGTGIDGSRYTSAFQTQETGAYLGDMGLRVENAFPCWNIWANNQPGEWKTNRTGAGILQHWLRKDSGGPLLTLDFFAGHNMDAPAPGIENVYKSFTQGQSQGIIDDYAIAINASLGEYDWKRASMYATHWCIMLYDKEGNRYATSEIYPVGTGDKTFVITPIIFTSVEKTFEYEARVYLGNYGGGSFDGVGYIPNPGKVTIDIVTVPKIAKLTVYVNGYDNVFYIPKEFSETSYRYNFQGEYDFGVNRPTDNKRLVKVKYELVDNATQAVVKSYTATSGFGGATAESPTSLLSYVPSDNKQTFGISKSRIGTGNINQQLRAEMYYE